jgi:hypothetical protein
VAPRQPPAGPFRDQDGIVEKLASVARWSGDQRRIWVLTGSFGVGKTRVAQEVARRAQQDGLDVWWADARNRVIFECSMCEVALQVGVAHDELDRRGCGHAVVVPALQRYGRDASRWLLIVDEADRLRVLGSQRERREGTGWVQQPGPNGMIIITTRDGSTRHWWDGVEVYRVARLSPEHAEKMLIDSISAGGGWEDSIGSRREVRQLARKLGGLPILVRIVGLYLQQVSGANSNDVPAGLPRTAAQYMASLGRDVASAVETAGATIEDRGDGPDRANLKFALGTSIKILEHERLKHVRPLLCLLSMVDLDEFAERAVSAELFRDVRFLRPLAGADLLRQHLNRMVDFGLLERNRRAKHELLSVPRITRELAVKDVSVRRAATLRRLVDPITTADSLIRPRPKRTIAPGGRPGTDSVTALPAGPTLPALTAGPPARGYRRLRTAVSRIDPRSWRR